MNQIRATNSVELTKALKGIKADTLVTLAPAVYSGNFRGVGPANAVRRITLQGEHGAIIDGAGKDCLSLLNCPWWIVDGITFRNGLRGLYVANADHIEIRNCKAEGNQMQGIMVSSTDAAKVTGCECSGSVQEHGCYLSHCTNVTFEYNLLHDNGGCGINVNWQASGWDVNDPTKRAGAVRRCTIYGNGAGNAGRGGGAGINALSLRDLEITDNVLYDCAGGGVSAGSCNIVKVSGGSIRIRKGVHRACVMSAAGTKQMSATGIQWEMGTEQDPFQTDHGGELVTSGNTPYVEAAGGSK